MMTNSRLPGIRSFIMRSAMFRSVKPQTANSAAEVISMTHEALRSGKLRVGDAFPVPDELASRTGAKLTDSVEAVAALLKQRVISQQASGRLIVARKPAA